MPVSRRLASFSRYSNSRQLYFSFHSSKLSEREEWQVLLWCIVVILLQAGRIVLDGHESAYFVTHLPPTALSKLSDPGGNPGLSTSPR